MAKNPTPAEKTVRSPAAVRAKQQDAQQIADYRVIEPFWLNGAVVKPTEAGAPVFVEMTEAEAQPYLDAGVVAVDDAK